MLDEHAPPLITFDVLFNVLRNTLLSPFFAAGQALFSYYGQSPSKRILGGTNDPTGFLIYFGVCWLLWFVPLSSRVWENRAWRKGWRGIAGIARIDWTDQIVLVTGGKQGLGKAIVDILDMKKVTVVALDLTLPEPGPVYNDVHFYACDVSDLKQVQAIGEQISREVGHPTVLINNAGVVSGKSMLSLTEADVRKTFGVNTIAHFWTIKTFLPHMLASGQGHIVNVSSILGQIGVNYLTDYCASKHAVIGMHESLRSELKLLNAHDKVKLSLVQPGHIRTALFERIKPNNALARFLLPMQDTFDIARAIVDKIERVESGTIFVPKLVGVAWLWSGLPRWLDDALRVVSGSDSSMANFADAAHADRIGTSLPKTA